MFKKINNKYFLLSAFFIIFLFLVSNPVLALEVDLGLGSNPTLPQYAVFLYSWGISIAGGLAAISFVIGAVGLIASGDNSELAGNSKDRMKGAILGLVLIGASFIIMNTINPALVKPTLTPLTPVVIPTPPPQPGVYYYSQSGCAGNGSAANTNSQDNIAAPFNGNIKSVKIIDDTTNDLNYGVIFHQVAGLKNGGKCSDLITNAGCTIVNMPASAADIFMIKGATTYSSLNIFEWGVIKDAVTFYSAPYGWNSGARAGFNQIGEKEINPYDTEEASQLTFDYTNIDRSSEYKTSLCATFQNCPGAIKLKGKYLVALYSGSSAMGSYCQTFTADVPNLNVQPFIASGGQNINMVDIYATK